MNTVHVEGSCTLPRVIMLNRSYYHMYVHVCVFFLRPHLSIVLQRVASWKLSSTSLLKVLTWRAQMTKMLVACEWLGVMWDMMATVSVFYIQ